jgi:glycosyltransferase involved in cell wall biosynthesis
MKILVISSEPCLEHNNLLSNYVLGQASELQRLGNDVDVICFSFISVIDYIKDRRLIGFTTKNNIVVEKLHIPAFIPFRFLPINLKVLISKAWVKVFLSNRVMDYDIQICNNLLFAGILAKAIMDKFYTPYVIVEHSSYYLRHVPSTLVKRLYKNISRHASRIYTVSDFLGKRLKSHLDVNADGVIYNAVDRIYFNEVPNESNGSNEYVKLLNVGNLVDVKNQEVLIDLVHRLSASGRNLDLTIVGDGPLRKKLESKINFLHLNEFVRIVQCDNSNDLIHYFDSSDAYVHLSKFETFGIVVVEALSRGLPCFISKCGGPESFINKDNGIISDLQQEDLFQNIIIFLTNLDRYNCIEISRNAKIKFGPDSYSEMLKKVIQL